MPRTYRSLEERHLVVIVFALVVSSGALVYSLDRLAFWIAWWLGTTVLAGSALVYLNR